MRGIFERFGTEMKEKGTIEDSEFAEMSYICSGNNRKSINP